MKTKVWAIGVDLGGSKIKAAAVLRSGTVMTEITVSTDANHHYETIIGQIEEMVWKLIDDYPQQKPVGVGVGAPGQVDDKSGAVKFAPNLHWENAPLESDLTERLELPVMVLNDVRAATLGEWLFGAGRGCNNMICIFVGTGIGGGIVVNGDVVKGSGNAAGEIGHMTVLLDGPECRCGNRGCLEALAGSWAIERDARIAVADDPQPESVMIDMVNGDVEKITAHTVIEASKQGDALAVKLIDRATDALAGGITGLANVLNPERILLGGGVTEHLPDLIPNIDRSVRQGVLKASAEVLKITPAGLHEAAGVIGAASQIYRHANSDAFSDAGESRFIPWKR